MSEPVRVTLKDGSTRWRMRVDLGRDPVSGRRLQTTITAGTIAECKRLAGRARGSARDGIAARSASRLTVGRYLRDEWLPHKRASGTVRASTLRGIRIHVDRHIVPALGGVPLTRLSTLRVQQWVNQAVSKCAASTVRVQFTTLNQAMRQAVRWQLITRNPCEGVTLPVVRREPRSVWDREAVEAFLEATSSRPYHAAWCILARTGLRVGELCALQWGDVDLAIPCIYVRRTATTDEDGAMILGDAPKSEHGRRPVLLDADTARVLGELPRRSVFVVPGRAGMVSDETIRANLKRDCARLGLAPITPHAFRHAHGTHMMELEVHPSIAMQRLGHGSLDMAKQYQHPELRHQAAVIARLRDKTVTTG